MSSSHTIRPLRLSKYLLFHPRYSFRKFFFYVSQQTNINGENTSNLRVLLDTDLNNEDTYSGLTIFIFKFPFCECILCVCVGLSVSWPWSGGMSERREIETMRREWWLNCDISVVAGVVEGGVVLTM